MHLRSCVLRLAAAVALLAAVAQSTYAWQPAPVVQTTTGPVVGFADGNMNVYLGIRYAAAPVGDLRWTAPTPPTPWQQPYNASAYGAACWQYPQLGPVNPPPSEDCLFLNVWTPDSASPDGEPLPVVFWIHGGGFFIGDASTYPGDFLVGGSQAVLLVTINYRLAALGYLALPGLATEPTNYGLLDQLAALQWVADNIAAFGGDPHRVTIAGQSAGGAAVAILLSNKAAWPLYSRAILQSPETIISRTDVEALEHGQSIAEFLECSNGTAADVVACMRAVNASLIGNLTSGVGNRWAWEIPVPFVNGREFPVPIVEAFVSGIINPTAEILIGTTEYEGNFFSLVSGFSDPMTLEAQYTAAMEGFFSAPLVTSPLNASTFALQRYAGNVTAGGNYWPAWSQALGDAYISCGTEIAAVALGAAGRPAAVYRYLLEETVQGTPLSFLNATHTSDLYYLFPTFPLTDPRDAALSSQMVAAWVQFAYRGHPGNSTTWPAYSYPPGPTSGGVTVLSYTPGTVIPGWDTACADWLPYLVASTDIN